MHPGRRERAPPCSRRPAWEPPMLRASMDRLYRVSEILAAALVFLICAMILVQVALGVADRLAVAVGARVPGLSVPSYAELAAFFLAAAVFLGLAGALRAGAHVRVSLLLGAVPARLRRGMETACALLGCGIAGFFAWCAGLMTRDSWMFGDLSFGTLPIPMWIPQSTMVIGLAVLALAFLDLALTLLRGGEDPARSAAPTVGG